MSNSSDVDRRRFLSGGLKLAGSAVVLGPLAAACGSSSSSNSGGATTSASSTAAAGTPKRGGTLTIGSIGSDQDTLDAQYSSTNMDQQRGQNLYDSLYSINEDKFTFTPALAESIEMNAGATVATIRLRKGVEFHNGKTLSAEDLIFSLKRILNPSNPGNAHSSLAAIDPSGLKQLDKYTVRCHLKSADAMLPYRWGNDQTSIVPVGFDPKKPVGTGPFMLQSFTPGGGLGLGERGRVECCWWWRRGTV
jgi:peptide/nickel transport system substrate-binding protein